MTIQANDERTATRKPSKTLLLGMMAVLVALAIGLVGCGSQEEPDYTKNFSGEWTLTSLVENGEKTTEKELKAMKSWGMTFSLTLNEDKTATLDILGEKLEGTWEPKDATTATVTMDNQDVDAILDGDELTLKQDDEQMTFERADDESDSSTSTKSSASSSSSDA